MNELTERYYKSKPRGYDDPWPIEQHKETDSVLRKFLTSYVEKPPKEIVQLKRPSSASSSIIACFVLWPRVACDGWMQLVGLGRSGGEAIGGSAGNN